MYTLAVTLSLFIVTLSDIVFLMPLFFDAVLYKVCVCVCACACILDSLF